MGGRSLRLLVLSAVLLTFTANLLFVLQTKECYKETKEIFPWLKNKWDVEVSKVVKYSDEGAMQDNLGKRIIFKFYCKSLLLKMKPRNRRNKKKTKSGEIGIEIVYVFSHVSQYSYSF
jgi:hypothetical protein